MIEKKTDELISQRENNAEAGMVKWMFTFKPQSWQKKLGSWLSFSEHVQVLSVKSRLETHSQTNRACGVPTGWIKVLLQMEEDDSRHRFMSHKRPLWIILIHLIKDNTWSSGNKDRGAGAYSKEEREMDSTKPCCPETVSLGSSCKEECGGTPLHGKWTAFI